METNEIISIFGGDAILFSESSLNVAFDAG